MNIDTQDKWNKIYEGGDVVPAMKVVVDNLHLLPVHGKGLELACGLAENSFLIAERGIAMEAWDISSVAVERVQEKAKATGATVEAAVRDVTTNPPKEAVYDLVVATHFLEHSITNEIAAAIKPGGLLFFQTYTRAKVSEGGPKRDEWRLAEGELLTLFPGMRPVVYREEGLLGDTTKGFRNEALLVAQKL